MKVLRGKKVLLAVTGSIAAYKAANLVRLLIKAGAEVQVLMTDYAKEFITPLTLSTLSKRPVFSNFVKNEAGEWTNHVDLALWADVMLVAPASANTTGKMAQGICDNLVLACYFSAKCPVIVAPAMDLDMYQHPAVKANLEKLLDFGNLIIPAESGELASGLSGVGRLAEPEHILAYLERFFDAKLPLKGKSVLVTAGPTYENIDPVRFIGNHSSGKMGFALAEELARLGADVQLVTGPTSLVVQHSSIVRTDVVSAESMYTVCMALFPKADIAIMSAAVADYTPAEVAEEKIKKKSDAFTISLKPTIDILAAMGKQKKPDQTLIGFALETENEKENALGKLERKNLDFIVLNSLKDSGAGFKGETNRISIFGKNNKSAEFELKSKSAVALDIIDFCILKRDHELV